MKSVRNKVLSGLMATVGSVLVATSAGAQSPENHTNVPDLGRTQTLPYAVNPDTVPSYSHPVPGAGYYGYGYGYPGAYYSDDWRERQWREAQLREQQLREQELREAQRRENRRLRGRDY